MASFVVLVAALTLAGLLWCQATTRTEARSRIVGNAQATVTRSETSMNGLLVAGAVVLLSAGVGTSVAFLPPPSMRTRPGGWKGATLAAGIVAIAATGMLLATREPSSLAPRARGLIGPAFETTAEFVAAMERAGLGCDANREVPVGARADQARVCSVPWKADIRDGYDDVLLTRWRSDDALHGWVDENVEDSTRLVVGPGWAARCEFRSTCALIAHRLRSPG